MICFRFVSDTLNFCKADAVPNCFDIDEYSMHVVVVNEVIVAVEEMVVVVVVVVLNSVSQLNSVVNVPSDAVVSGTLVVTTGLVFVLT